MTFDKLNVIEIEMREYKVRTFDIMFSLIIHQVIDYLLWAAMCMETSVPLLELQHLAWRSTLYTAICQCYFDCKADQEAEVKLLGFGHQFLLMNCVTIRLVLFVSRR